MRTLRVFLPFLLVGILALAPLGASAGLTQIIPTGCYCEGGAPDWGCALQVVQNVMNLAIAIGFMIFVLALVYAGLTFIASPISAKGRELGKTILMNSVVGLVIMLCAWLLVDFVMKALYNEDASAAGIERLGPWNSILGAGGRACLLQRDPPAGLPGTSSVDATSGITGQTGQASQIKAFYEAAQSAGLSAVYEVRTSGRKQELVSAGVPAAAITAVSYITGEHFSVYSGGGCGGQASSQLKTNPSCTNCQQITGPTCKSSSSCTITASVNSALNSIPQTNVEIGSWRVTEAFPPTTQAHNCSCHYTGTCVDVGFF